MGDQKSLKNCKRILWMPPKLKLIYQPTTIGEQICRYELIFEKILTMCVFFIDVFSFFLSAVQRGLWRSHDVEGRRRARMVCMTLIQLGFADHLVRTLCCEIFYLYRQDGHQSKFFDLQIEQSWLWSSGNSTRLKGFSP